VICLLLIGAKDPEKMELKLICALKTGIAKDLSGLLSVIDIDIKFNIG
jgi:hypothetical protein